MSVTLVELRQLKPQIMQYADQHGISDIRVFGSVARGDVGARSDVDLLVNLKPGTRFSGYLRFVQALTDLLKTNVQVIEEKAIMHPLVKQSIYEDAVEL